MKTLDEVITANECCNHCELDSRCEDCPYSGIGACALERETDTLHYLKEYRETKKHLACLDDAEIRGDDTQLVNNPPLTWDELREMKGKPVWMEDDTGTKHYRGWAIILEFRYSDTFILYVCNDYSETCVDVEDIGDTWQAYRKERG